MSTNDKTIEDYRKKIETRRNKLGVKPNLSYESNGILILNNKTTNINILNTVDCRKILAEILLLKFGEGLVDKELGTEVIGYLLDNYISDIKQKILVNSWQEEKKKLTAMDKKLAELLSDKAKTENAIKDITKELDLD